LYLIGSFKVLLRFPYYEKGGRERRQKRVARSFIPPPDLIKGASGGGVNSKRVK
jgi:hypothetical protein